MVEPVVSGMTALITTLTAVFTATIQGVEDIIQMMMTSGNELLLLSAGFLFAGFIYSILGKLLRNS